MIAHKTDAGASGWKQGGSGGVTRAVTSRSHWWDLLCPVLFLLYCCCSRLINCLLSAKEENIQCQHYSYIYLYVAIYVANIIYARGKNIKGEGGEENPSDTNPCCSKARVSIKKSHERPLDLNQIPSEGDHPIWLDHLQIPWAALVALLGVCDPRVTVCNRLTEKPESNQEVIVSQAFQTLSLLEACVGIPLRPHIRETQSSGSKSRIESLLCHTDHE